MAESGNSKQFKLKVANFGPIARADIDLRPLTVFVGPSNTGKSYLAMLIYALHRFFKGRRIGRRSRYFRSLPRSRQEDDDISDEEIDALLEWVKQGIQRGTVPPAVAVPIRRRLRDVRSFGDGLNDELARCFGIGNTGDLIRHRSDKGASVDMDWQVSDHPEPFRYGFTLKRDGCEFDTSVPDTIPLSINLSDTGRLAQLLRELEDDEDRKESVAYVMNSLSTTIASRIVSPLSRRAHYLPADRTGVMHSHRVVVASIVDRAPLAALRPGTPLPEFSSILSDFLIQLISIEDSPRREKLNPIRNLASRLEKAILDGAIQIEESVTSYPEFYYRPEGWERDIPLMNSSSMVSELAPVVLYLRHVVERRDVLIIEEPESHLHPEMQVKFVRQLAAVVNAGIRVMLTTHSEWVLEELANLLQLEELRKARGDDFVDTSSALTQDQLGVWLFDREDSADGTVVREIPLDFEIGNFPSGYDDVAMDVYNRWAKISNLIEESKS